MYGNFGYKWTPPDKGTYLTKAFFFGSESYYGSQATRHMDVDPEPVAYRVPPSADEIAQTTINRLPAYPDVPSASEVAQEA